MRLWLDGLDPWTGHQIRAVGSDSPPRVGAVEAALAPPGGADRGSRRRGEQRIQPRDPR
jgi:hypothetical protein